MRSRSRKMVRGTLTFSGDVQNIGFRGLALRKGRNLGLTGYVENLPDGRVKIICEGPKWKIMELSDILRRADDMIHVDRAIRRFSKARREFKRFEVKFEDLSQEMFQGFDTAAKYLTVVRDEVKVVGRKVDVVGDKVDEVGRKVDVVGEKVDEVGRKVDVVGEKVDEVGRKVDVVGDKVDEVGRKVDVVGEKVDEVGRKVDAVGETVNGVGNNVNTVGGSVRAMHEDMNNRFLEMNEKYHVISETLIAHTDALTRLVDDYISEKTKNRTHLKN